MAQDSYHDIFQRLSNNMRILTKISQQLHNILQVYNTGLDKLGHSLYLFQFVFFASQKCVYACIRLLPGSVLKSCVGGEKYHLIQFFLHSPFIHRDL